jgi:hypothetical protein
MPVWTGTERNCQKRNGEDRQQEHVCRKQWQWRHKNRSPGFLIVALDLTLGQIGFPANYLCPLKFHQSVIGGSFFLRQLLKNTPAAQNFRSVRVSRAPNEKTPPFPAGLLNSRSRRPWFFVLSTIAVLGALDLIPRVSPLANAEVFLVMDKSNAEHLILSFWSCQRGRWT